MSEEKLKCEVCDEEKLDNETHFGVRVCRACAAFFRRSVAQKRIYHCRKNKSCTILSEVRGQCRFCRFAKCLSVGMKKTAVQKIRGRREKRVELDEAGTSTSQSDEPVIVTEYLTTLHQNYTHIERIRRIAHHTDSGNSLFKTRQPKAVNYKESSRICSKECDLIADCIINTFAELEQLPEDQKNILFNNFFLPFILLQNSYFSCLQNRSDIIILGNGDYIDCDRLETFFYDPDGGQTMSPEDAVKMFAPAFANYRRNVIDPMLQEGVDKHELLALVSLVLFDPGLDEQTEECVKFCLKYREAIHRELLHYYETVRNVPEPLSRFAFSLSLLPALQRATRRFQQDVEIKKIFNVYAFDEKFYKICRGQ